MYGVKLKDKNRQSEIKNRTKVTNILYLIDHKKWGWTGQMLQIRISGANRTLYGTQETVQVDMVILYENGKMK